MAEIIDVSFDTSSKAAALAAAGVGAVIRYYSRDTTRPAKRLSRPEAAALTSAGLRIAIVHEGRRGDEADNFDHDCGVADGDYAQTYGRDTIGQPTGSTIYYGVDFDASASQIRERVIPYFQGVAESRAAFGDGGYAVGVYGSGRTCASVLDAGLATKAWLAQSTGWGDHAVFLASDRWTLNQGMPVTIAGIECDPNTLGAGKDMGDFALARPPMVETPGPTAALTVLYTIARHGLRLREGPGIDFAASPNLLPYGTPLHAIRTVEGWTLVDRAGDGKADGFVSSAFLATTAPGAQPAAAVVPAFAVAHTADAAHVAELIRQGSSADGLRLARETAAAALPGYPVNGCAAHLSALLQQAGVATPMTWGAGKLATLLAARGWTRVERRAQAPGDVGVCFDNNPNPPGADHIYLVIQTLGDDEMLIADNQRTADAPHQRFATGRGRTPTEFFLRAL